MEEIYSTLKNLLSLSNVVDPSLKILSEKSGALTFGLNDRGTKLEIVSLINDHKLMLEANIYLSTLGLHPECYVAKTPKKQTGPFYPKEPRIDIDLDLMKMGNAYPNPDNNGRGISQTVYWLDNFCNRPDKLKDYYKTMQKFNKLIDADLTAMIPKTAELRLVDGRPHIEINFMDGWFEMKKLIFDNNNENVKLEKNSEKVKKVPEISQKLKKHGFSAEDLSLITHSSFTNDLFYQKFVDKISEVTNGQSKYVVHASFSWNEDATPSVLLVPLVNIIKDKSAINIVLDGYTNFKNILANKNNEMMHRN